MKTNDNLLEKLDSSEIFKQFSEMNIKYEHTKEENQTLRETYQQMIDNLNKEIELLKGQL